MARDFDAELARAMEKVERIKKAKDAVFQRRRESIGKVMMEVFPDLEEFATQKEIKAFIEAHLRVREGDEREDTSYNFSENVPAVDNFAEPEPFEE